MRWVHRSDSLLMPSVAGTWISSTISVIAIANKPSLRAPMRSRLRFAIWL